MEDQEKTFWTIVKNAWDKKAVLLEKAIEFVLLDLPNALSAAPFFLKLLILLSLVPVFIFWLFSAIERFAGWHYQLAEQMTLLIKSRFLPEADYWDLMGKVIFASFIIEVTPWLCILAFLWHKNSSDSSR